MNRTIQTMNGIEASRRVGWAKYYKVVEANQELRRALDELANLIVFDPRIRGDDKILMAARAALATDWEDF